MTNYTQKEIAKLFNTSKSTIFGILKEKGIMKQNVDYTKFRIIN